MLRQMMTHDQYMQEFECSWNANVPGAIYGKELETATTEGRVTKVPYDPSAQSRYLVGLGCWG